MKYIAIYYGNNNIYVEVKNYSKKPSNEELLEDFDRNDDNILLLKESEYKKLVKIIDKELKKPSNKMIKL